MFTTARLQLGTLEKHCLGSAYRNIRVAKMEQRSPQIEKKRLDDKDVDLGAIPYAKAPVMT
jgi:hypothetical protein